jgi:hypothetical protein
MSNVIYVTKRVTNKEGTVGVIGSSFFLRPEPTTPFSPMKPEHYINRETLFNF